MTQRSDFFFNLKTLYLQAMSFIYNNFRHNDKEVKFILFFMVLYLFSRNVKVEKNYRLSL